MTLESLIKDARLGRGWTQAMLAEHVGISKAHVSEIEHDIRQASMTVLLTLCEVLGIEWQSRYTVIPTFILEIMWAAREDAIGQLAPIRVAARQRPQDSALLEMLEQNEAYLAQCDQAIAWLKQQERAHDGMDLCDHL